MEQEKSLVKTTEVKLPAFVENAYQTLEGMKEFSNMLLESRLLPPHFYEKGSDNKPDYSKGKTASVTLVLLQAQQLQIPPMTALQHIIPVNGLLSIKGDLAKTMIFASGKLKKGSWKEEVKGTIENENMEVLITATREDNELTLTRSFSVDQAKRAGLWITQQQINGSDGWKYKASAWYKFPHRMINYRALGFLARDLFSDVLNNLYLTEEAIDMPKDQTEIIDTEGGKITLPDKQFSQERSGNMTERATRKIKETKFEPIQDNQAHVQDAKVLLSDEEKQKLLDLFPQSENFPSQSEFIAAYNKYVVQLKTKHPDEFSYLEYLKAAEPSDKPENEESPFKAEKGSVAYMDGKVVEVDGKPVNQGSVSDADKLTLKEMEAMDVKTLLVIINNDSEMIEAMESIPGKNTNKKLREIIFAKQNSSLDEHVAKFVNTEEPEPSSNESPAGGSEIPPNKDFDKQGTAVNSFMDDDKPKESGNKFNIEILAYDKGNSREFATTKTLFNALSKAGIDNNKYIAVATAKNLLGTYPDKEAFLKFASTSEINDFLNSI